MTLLLHRLLADFKGLFHRLAGHEALLPGIIVGQLVLWINLLALGEHVVDYGVPRNKSQIGHGRFVAHQILAALESSIQDIQDAFNR